MHSIAERYNQENTNTHKQPIQTQPYTHIHPPAYNAKNFN